MSQIASPYGLRVVKLLGDLPFSGGENSYPLITNNTQGIFFGDPVNLAGGSIVPIAAGPVTSAIGVFMGASWQDPIRGFVNAQYLPANAVTAGYKNILCKIADYPWQVMRIQADGSVPATSLGMCAAMGNFTAGSVSTGNSQVNLASASVGATAAALRIYGFVQDAAPSPGAGSMPGDPFTDILVVWNFGIHRYLQNTGA